MRVSDNMNYNQVTSNLQKNRSEVSRLQNQAATMKKVTKPSDDPIGAARVLATRSSRKLAEQHLRSQDMAKSFIDATERALGEVSEGLMRAKELALSQANDPSSNETTRQTVAVEINQLFGSMINVGNRKLGDRFIFGGFSTKSKPFEATGEYKGTDGEIQIEINKGVYLPVNLSGQKVFLGDKSHKAPSWSEKESAPHLRGPASVESNSRNPNTAFDVRNSNNDRARTHDEDPLSSRDGVHIFNALKKLQIGLVTNDKTAVQESLVNLDKANEQIILSRAEMGSRSMALEHNTDTLKKEIIESKALESSIEDADVYELFTDIKKTENTLNSSLQTSGQLITPSLLDFLK
jgi:flagellar hook-associated protein 3 FlgL